jgi:hypothetical protein
MPPISSTSWFLFIYVRSGWSISNSPLEFLVDLMGILSCLSYWRQTHLHKCIANCAIWILIMRLLSMQRHSLTSSWCSNTARCAYLVSITGMFLLLLSVYDFCNLRMMLLLSMSLTHEICGTVPN